MRKISLFLCVTFAVPLLLAANPSSQETGLLNHVAQNASQIKDLSTSVHFKIKLAQLGFAFDMDGKFYYKQPDKVRLKLNGVPSILSSYEDRIFRSADVMAGLPQYLTSEYYVSQIKATSTGYVIELHPYEKRNVSKIFVKIETAHFTVPVVVFFYHDGSSVRIESHYIAYHSVYLVSQAHTVYTPANHGMQADADATFSDFHLNEGIPDSIFNAN